MSQQPRDMRTTEE